MPPTDSVHGHDGTPHKAPPTSDALFAAAYSHGSSSGRDFGSSVNEFGSAFSHLGGAIASGYESLCAMDLGVHVKEAEIGRGIAHAVGGAIDASGREMTRENPEVPAAGNAIAGAYNRVADFARTRPATFAAESVLPGLSIIDGLARGGLPEQHDSHPPQAVRTADVAQPRPAGHDTPTEAQPAPQPARDQAQPHPAAHEAPTEAQQHHTPSAVRGHHGTEHDPRHVDQAAPAPAARNDGAACATHNSAEVHHGDGYWSVAARILGHNGSNVHIAELAHKLQTQNGGKALQPGDRLTYSST